MFRAYALDLNDIQSLIKDYSAKSIYPKVKTNEIIDELEYMIRGKKDFFNAEELCNLFFPVANCPVFLSHSGQDKEDVDRFAQWLKEKFDINAFVDSDLWGCIRDLQKKIDQSCRIDRKTHEPVDENLPYSPNHVYSYSQRNISTSHVHMILCHALTQMINSAECFIFLKSDKSISLENAQQGTFSPWIFHELATVETIKENRNRFSLPQHIANENFSAIVEGSTEAPKVFYPISMKRPFLLSKEDLVRWSAQNFENDYNNLAGDWTTNMAACFCDAVGDETVGACKKWEMALNWLYINCHSKGRIL